MEQMFAQGNQMYSISGVPKFLGFFFTKICGDKTKGMAVN